MLAETPINFAFLPKIFPNSYKSKIEEKLLASTINKKVII